MSPFRIVVNPAAGRGKGAEIIPRLRSLAGRTQAEMIVTGGAAEVTDEARRAASEGVERLIVAGGDGTAHLAAQGLAGTPCALGILPLGRGNDLADEMIGATSLEEALSRALEGPVRSIDVGRLRGRVFNGVAGAGFDGEVVRRTQLGFPRLRGSLVYPAAVLRTLAGFRPPRLRIEHDDGVFEGPAMLFAVANLTRYGGGMRIAPRARPDDGLLDLVVVRAMSRARLLAVFPKVYSGRHETHPAVEFHRTRRVRVVADRALTVQSDGELEGETPPEGLEFEIWPGALRIAGARPAAT